MIRESKLEKDLCKFAKEHGISTLKLNGQGNKGKADRLFMKDGVAFFMEIKRPGGVLTELQKRFLDERRADGFHAEWVDSYARGAGLLKTFLLGDN